MLMKVIWNEMFISDMISILLGFYFDKW